MRSAPTKAAKRRSMLVTQPRQVTKQEAIAMLASHLGAAKRRGYSPEELANLLSAKGIAINTATLRG